MLEQLKARREADAKRFKEMDDDLCQICWAYGQDKRSFKLYCFYDVSEIIPEAIDMFAIGDDKDPSYYLRVCKSCRGSFLTALKQAADGRRALREEPKDHDGYIDDGDSDANIPVRINGATVMMNAENYAEWKARNVKNKT